MHEGSVLDVATMDVEAGSRVELRDVLLLSDAGKITVGSPLVADALVVAEVVEHGKGKKVVNFKFKAKTRYRRKRGHRQGYTRLSVTEIRLGDAPASAAAAPARRRARAATVEATEAETPAAEAAVKTVAKTPAAPRRRTRAATPEATESTETLTQE